MGRLDKLVARFFKHPHEVRVEDVRKILELLGYEERRGGKHVSIFRHPSGKMLTVPTVSGRKVKRIYVRLVARLLEEAGYGQDD